MLKWKKITVVRIIQPLEQVTNQMMLRKHQL